MYDLTYGTDPEYFIVENIEGKPYSVPVPHFIENLGVKEIGFDPKRKHPVIYKNDDFKIMMDGVAFEANPSPVKTAKEMYSKIQNILDVLGEFASKFGYSVSVSPTVYYDFFKWYKPDNQLLEQCGIFGCDPDQDAIMEDYISPEINVTTHPYRYGGGHLHVSDNNLLIGNYPRPMIRLMALTVGNYSIYSSSMPKEEKLRMFKYGLPGRFRIQNYPDGNTGVEYRSPSNLWTSKLDTIEGMMYWTNKAYELLNNQDKAINALETYLDLTVEAIQQVDQNKAGYILSKIGEL